MLSPKALLVSLLVAFDLFTLPYASKITKSDSLHMPSFAFSWLNNNDTFVAGDVATIKVKVLGNLETGKYKHHFSPNITVNEKMGNSSYISWITSHFDDGDFESWRISFVPIMVGLFNVLITDDNFNVLDSSLHFEVIQGPMYPADGIASWMGGVNEFVAGTTAAVLILPRDAFGNNVSLANGGSNFYNLTLLAYNASGSATSIFNVTNKGWNQLGYLCIEFIPVTAGSLLLFVEVENQTLMGSPLPFKVNPGPLDVSNCEVQWNIDTKFFQLFSVMEAFIHQLDLHGNLVPGLYAFDVEVFEKGTNLSIPVADLHFKEVVPGIQSFSFSLIEPGDFMLMISDKEQNNLISKMPYDFTVYIGYCDGLKSTINGSGLNHSVAGEVQRLSVFLKDAYLYPSPVEIETVRVQIRLESDRQFLQTVIRPMEIANGLNYNAATHEGLASAPMGTPKNNSAENLKSKTSAFDVIFIPEKIGVYEIRVFCGNILLNGGHPFRKEVTTGKVNVSVSGVVKYATKVSKLIKNEIVVQLMDSYYNPVLLQQSKLKLEIGSLNKSGFQAWAFVDNQDGSYTGSYLAMDVGTYEICASFDGERFMPCPFGVNVYSSEYFPKVSNDLVSVWEDESITFDALENDYFSGGSASIFEFSKPRHGSLLQHGRLFRYTPHKGYYGNDSFSYTISDVNGNLASGSVFVSVLSIPPQFVSVPSRLQATEDVISPTFGGFAGFEIMYSNLTENITVALTAQSGTVFLSPMLMQFWQPTWSELSVNQNIGKTKELTLVGCLQVINFALQSIQYFGNENFSGTDTIRISTINRSGKNDLDIPIIVEPINDPPSINIPSFIILDEKQDEVPIFDTQRDKFDFFIGDPDLHNFPGNESHFLVMFSVEVTSGFLSTKLPAELISTTELKLKTSYQWQPLQTFVTISEHFTVKAKGIRFRGTINECNNIMQQLLFHGGEHGAVLTIKVNDMGNYGCYPDCGEMMSMSLFAEATLNLVRRRPMSSLVAHTLGTAIVVEFLLVFSLGVLFLFFICKCAIVLIHETRKQQALEIQDSKVESSHRQIELSKSVDSPEEVTHFAGCCSSPFLRTGQPSNFSQRSRHLSGIGQSGIQQHHEGALPSTVVASAEE